MWDGNVLLQEWYYDLKDRPKQVIDELGEISYDREEPVENLITWLYEEGTFSPIGKIESGETYYIVNDYLGTPTQAFNTEGELIWRRELDIYGKVRYLEGEEEFIPFRYQGQYYDKETQLCYNRFRYYSPETGLYISQDPIGLAGNNPNFYADVFDSNAQVDVFGLDCNKIESKIDDVDNSKIFLAKKYKLNINSPITQQIIDSLDKSVDSFILTYRESSIRAEVPSEFINQTVEEALKNGNSTIRKLLTDGRFIKK